MRQLCIATCFATFLLVGQAIAADRAHNAEAVSGAGPKSQRCFSGRRKSMPLLSSPSASDELDMS